MAKLIALIFTVWGASTAYQTFSNPPKDEYIKVFSKTHSIRHHSIGSSVFRGGGFNFGK